MKTITTDLIKAYNNNNNYAHKNKTNNSDNSLYEMKKDCNILTKFMSRFEIAKIFLSVQEMHEIQFWRLVQHYDQISSDISADVLF